jgi:hypothetical protein
VTRTRGVVAAAVMSIVVGAFTLLLEAGDLPVLFLQADTQLSAPIDFALRPWIENPGYLLYEKARIVLTIVAAAVILTAGVQMLKLRPWARKVAIGWAVWSFVSDIVTSFLFFTIFVPGLAEAAKSSGLPPAATKAGIAISWVGMGSLTCVNMVIPVILVGLLMRPAVAEAFRTGVMPSVPVDPAQPRKG